MHKALRSTLVAGSLLASIGSAEMLSPTTAEAAASYTCKDKNGGTIDQSDFDIQAAQRAVGASVDGNFGPNTCAKTIAKLVEQNHMSAGTSTLRIGPIVLGWLGVSGSPTPPPEQGVSSPACTLTTSADVKAVQYAIGTSADGQFGRQSCNKLIQKLHTLGLLDSAIQTVTLTDSLAEKLGVDNDTKDRASCKKAGKCILVHAVLGKNKLELYQDGVLIDTTLVNTGMEGMRTRNGNFSIGNEDFSEDGVHISRDDNGNKSSGRMGDPHYFSRGQAFHWRVNYGSAVGTGMASDTAFPYADWKSGYENNVYNGGYASHGCVHVPHSFMARYDNNYFISRVKVVVRDQPTK